MQDEKWVEYAYNIPLLAYNASFFSQILFHLSIIFVISTLHFKQYT